MSESLLLLPSSRLFSIPLRLGAAVHALCTPCALESGRLGVLIMVRPSHSGLFRSSQDHIAFIHPPAQAQTNLPQYSRPHHPYTPLSQAI